jgi:tetratricopeptide (TPR) repeat protein
MAYRDFAVQKQLADEKAEAAVVIKAVRDWMEQNERWLFIFDNAESSEVLKKYLPLQQQGTRHVLITSRYAYWYGVAETVEVGVFRPEQAEEFLTEATKKPADNNQKKLAQELGYLPLALDQAAAYINVHQKSYSEYLELFRKRRLEVLKKFPSADKNRQTVATTWDISIEKIGETSAARQLFNLCAFFAPEDIARRWFQKSCAVLPEPLRTAVPDELAYDEITETICRYSLATRRQGNLSLHRLVQEVIRDSMGGEREYWANLCISALINCIYDDFSTLENRVEFLTLLPHITATTGHAETTLPEEKAKLYDFAGRGSYELAMFDSALEWFGRALTISEKVFGKDHPDTATSDNNIAVVYHSQGDYPKAIEWHQKALDIFEKVLGKEHQATAATYNNIANVYDSQGDYPEALKWHRKALAVKEKVPGKDHPDTATSYNNIALVYYSQGDYPKALKWHRKALAVKEKVLGKEHPDTAASYNNIANVYHSQGDYPEALEWHKKALAVKEKVRGKDHPNTAMSYGNIANVYDSQGDYPEALKWHKKALAVKEKVLGKGHPDTAMSYHNIANVYHNQGDSPKALEWFLSAFTIFARTLGHNHPKTKTALGNMAETYKETTMSLPFEKWLAEKLHWK